MKSKSARARIFHVGAYIVLLLLTLNILASLDTRLAMIPQRVDASSYSGQGAYVFGDSSTPYCYFVNSSAAGYLWYWDERYPGIQNLGNGGQLRLHSNYAYDLKPEEMGVSVIYWEYEDHVNYARVTSSSGYSTQAV